MCDSAVIDQCRRAAWMLRRRLECPGWNALGSGHFSVALEVPGHADELVLKVGGPSHYGYRVTGGPSWEPSTGMMDLDGTKPSPDAWPLWALESMTHPARPVWMPVVHHFEWLNQSETVYMAILERLWPTGTTFWLERPENLMEFIRDEWIPSMDTLGLDDDLHSGNWMYRRHGNTTDVVLTDPVIFRF